MKTVHIAIIAAVLVGMLFVLGGSPSKPSAITWETKMIQRDVMVPKVVGDTTDPANAKEWQKTFDSYFEAAEKSEKQYKQDLEEAGKQGWELVAVTTTTANMMDAADMFMTTAYLKRQRK